MPTRYRFINLTYYETYYFAQLVKDVLEDQPSDFLSLDEFCLNLEGGTSFPRVSALHRFIFAVVEAKFAGEDIQLDIRQDEADQLKSSDSAPDPHPSKLPVDLTLDHFRISHTPFAAWLEVRNLSFVDARDEHVQEYYDYLYRQGHMGELLRRVASEVFFVLFQNRKLLLLFNGAVACRIKERAGDTRSTSASANVFRRPRTLRRVALPSWVRRAVFFRDRGTCSICAADLSGLLAIGRAENYDHMVPLAEGGLNDITNIQLLCRDCNLRKSYRRTETSSRYEAWYPEH